FEVKKPYLTVTSPVDSDTWRIGTTQQISWEASAAGSQVDIDLLDESGSYLGTIASGVDTYSSGDAGSYMWNIEDALPDGTPVEGGATYQIRVTTTDGEFTDVSKAFIVAFSNYIAVAVPTVRDGLRAGGQM